MAAAAAQSTASPSSQRRRHAPRPTRPLRLHPQMLPKARSLLRQQAAPLRHRRRPAQVPKRAGAPVLSWQCCASRWPAYAHSSKRRSCGTGRSWLRCWKMQPSMRHSPCSRCVGTLHVRFSSSHAWMCFCFGLSLCEEGCCGARWSLGGQPSGCAGARCLLKCAHRGNASKKGKREGQVRPCCEGPSELKLPAVLGPSCSQKGKGGSSTGFICRWPCRAGRQLPF